MACSKYFNLQTLTVCYGNFTKKQNSDCLDLDNWLFKIGKKFGFYGDFSF